jgi:hypothetical protein
MIGSRWVCIRRFFMPAHFKVMNNKKRGNALFLILIAVALFAALSYAMTQSSRSGGGSISREQKQLIAAQMVQTGELVDKAVLRLTLAGCTDVQIDMAQPDGGTDFLYANPSAPTDHHCSVFWSEGGGIDPAVQKLPAGITVSTPVPDRQGRGTAANYYFSSSTDVVGNGTTQGDLVMIALLRDQELCRMIDTGLGAPWISTCADDGSNFDPAWGTYTLMMNGGMPDEDLSRAAGAGQTADCAPLVAASPATGCVPDAQNADGYIFYHVLLAR